VTRLKNTTFVVDAGDLLWKTGKISKKRLNQQRQKGALILEAYALSGVDAMVPGEADLSLGLDWLAGQAAMHALPYVAANLDCDGFSLPGGRVVERDGVTLGFVGVVGATNGGECTVSAPVPALKSAIAKLGDVDMLVLLSHQDDEADLGLVKALGNVDVVVNGHGRVAMKPPRRLGERAIQVSTGSRGKKLGIVKIDQVLGASGFIVDGLSDRLHAKIKSVKSRIERTKKKVKKDADGASKKRANPRLKRLDGQLKRLQAQVLIDENMRERPRHLLKNRLRGLNDDISDHSKTQALVIAAKAQISGAVVLKADKPARGSNFVGDTACLGCHQEQHGQWKSTPHAYAWSTLQRVGRSGDLDCWSCHVTGAGQPSGPSHPSEVSGLENVGCESCHGPGLAHTQTPMHSNIVRAPSEQTCAGCHDGVQDEGRFDFEAYIKRVTH